MADFNKAIGKTLSKEGGSRFTDDPNALHAHHRDARNSGLKVVR